jgi:hypothetical protein
MCIRLSDFLRRTLGLGEKESISWDEETQLVRAYLDIEQHSLRLAPARGDAGGWRVRQCQVPPLLLQPLVENAVKHGIATMVDGGTIQVNSRVEDGRTGSVASRTAMMRTSPTPRRQRPGAAQRSQPSGNILRKRRPIDHPSERASRSQCVPDRDDSAMPNGALKPSEKLRVVIVDDEELARQLLREYLDAEGRRGSCGGMRQRF